MSSDTHHSEISGLGGEVLEHTEVKVSHCYQCGKCSAGCPLSEEMDYPPSVIMRMLQTGNPALEDKVLRSCFVKDSTDFPEKSRPFSCQSCSLTGN